MQGGKERFFEEMRKEAPLVFKDVDVQGSFMSSKNSGLMTVMARRRKEGSQTDPSQNLHNSLGSLKRQMTDWSLGFFRPLRQRERK